MTPDASGGSQGTWSALVSLLWRRLRASRLLPSVFAASISSLVLMRDGTDPAIVLQAMVGGVAAAQAVLLGILQPMREATARTFEAYLAGRTEDDTSGWGYAVFEVLDVALPPAAAWFMAQWLAEMLPGVPESFGRITFVLSLAAAILAGLRVVLRWITWRQSQPRP